MKRNVIAAVLIFAALATGLFAQYAELEIAEIKRPFDVEEGGVGFKPKCVIHNNIDYTVNAKVTCRIKDLETFEQVYEDVLASFPCHGGNTTAEFVEEFVPEGGKDYNAWFRVEAPQTGDTKDKDFSTEGFDVTPYEMIVPQYGMYPPFSPEALFAEGLGLETPNVILHCMIDNLEESFSAIIYEDSLAPRTFTPYDTFDAVFTEVAELPYAYLITFWATDAEGNPISHPPYEELIYTNNVTEMPSPEFRLHAAKLDINFVHIHFLLENPTSHELAAYDVTGSRIASLSAGILGAGEHSVKWKIEDVPEGVYFIRFITPEFSTSRKITVIR